MENLRAHHDGVTRHVEVVWFNANQCDMSKVGEIRIIIHRLADSKAGEGKAELI